MSLKQKQQIRGLSLAPTGALFIFMQTSCCAPNQCRPAVVGFATYEPVVIAIEKYREMEGEYPDSLEVLVPSYLAEIPHAEGWRTPNAISYRKLQGNIELTFSYGGPGLNICGYDIMLKRWKCAGFY